MKNKAFSSLDEQIKILEKRNLEIKDKDYAKQYLLHNNYYNVINCYSKFLFKNKGVDCYIKGTTFENIIAIHHFDKEIKNCLFKFIIESEKHFKSILAYRYCKYFCDISYSYLDIKNYINSPKTTGLISQLKKIVYPTNKAFDKKPIKHYKNKYDNVPFWILVNYMTFGQTSTFFSCIPDKLKNIVAKDLSVFIQNNFNEDARLTSAQLESFLYNIVEVRNIIAHDNKLLDYKCKNNTKYNKFIHKKYGINETEPRQDVFNVCITLSCFLSKDEYEQLTNNIKEQIEKLKKEISQESSEKVISALGFPLNFEEQS